MFDLLLLSYKVYFDHTEEKPSAVIIAKVDTLGVEKVNIYIFKCM